MKFLLGVIATLVCVTAGMIIYLNLGLLSFNADEQPSAFERKLASAAVDASIKRRAPAAPSALQPSEADLIDSVRAYKMNCAVCHGDPGTPERILGKSFYPPVPQFMKEPADKPPQENFYIIKHGIAWTGMPAWGSSMSDDQIWKLTAFLAQMDKLPPGVDQEWKKGASAAGPAGGNATMKPSP